MNGYELREFEYCVNECERARPYRTNSVTGVNCQPVRIIVCEFGVTMARMVCEPRERAVNNINQARVFNARTLRIL